MRTLGILGGYAVADVAPPGSDSEPVVIDDVPVRARIMKTREPAFDRSREDAARQVLIRVSAFSCNYRDKAFALRARNAPAGRFFSIGSEFAAEVVAVGPAVTSLKPGDRVVGQNHYATNAFTVVDGVREGVVSNQASREYQVYHEEKLARIPDNMPDEVAAGFSLGAQTAYSMVRKLALEPGDHVLVTSGTSSTSVFAIPLFARRGVHVHVTTSSPRHDERLLALGAEDVTHVGGTRATFDEAPALNDLARATGGFHAVFDPFYDIHLVRATQLLLPFGRYITCGFSAQNDGAARRAGVRSIDLGSIMAVAIVKNLSITANCLGLKSDLDGAFADYAAGRFPFALDSVFTGEDAHGFLRRTFTDRARFGKVAFRYN